MALSAGTRVGPHEIIRTIGAGGMGEVFRARDTKLNRDVAIKALPKSVAEDAERRERFEREALALAALNHPGIVTVYAVESDNDTAFEPEAPLQFQTLRRASRPDIRPVWLPDGQAIAVYGGDNPKRPASPS